MKWRDHFTDRARREGYQARSAFKLEEIQRRTRVVPKGGRVVDLGCSPGSWATFVRRMGARVVGVDIQEPEDYPGTFIHGDVREVPPGDLVAALGGPADLVMSDMAPSTTGNPARDHIVQVELARAALRVASEALAPGGGLVIKVFEGGEARALVDDVRARFGSVRRIRPQATRKHSVEFFVVATGFVPAEE